EMAHYENTRRTVYFTLVIPRLAPCLSDFKRKFLTFYFKVLAEIIESSKKIYLSHIFNSLRSFIGNKRNTHLCKRTSKDWIFPHTFTQIESPPLHIFSTRKDLYECNFQLNANHCALKFVQ